MKLNAEWSKLLADYKADHKNVLNQACHSIGIPMIVSSIPVAATVVGLPLAVGMFTTGWAFQFAGHHFEGNDPSFFGDRRNLLVGVLWWAEKSGALKLETEPVAE
jgi:uncharacterized membrane protein YGL010W